MMLYFGPSPRKPMKIIAQILLRPRSVSYFKLASPRLMKLVSFYQDCRRRFPRMVMMDLTWTHHSLSRFLLHSRLESDCPDLLLLHASRVMVPLSWADGYLCRGKIICCYRNLSEAPFPTLCQSSNSCKKHNIMIPTPFTSLVERLIESSNALDVRAISDHELVLDILKLVFIMESILLFKFLELFLG
ncbi:hypothetical protein CARUB_v10007771mg [Capsella rubella]|uniref:Uncharacterized protein n=1 Tax=Capsella rubella TaxID=81985 RepID=R0H6D9_9BRAS|nr:hypothetical protein CARUB_v10007771mg [Capsella rubella]